MKLITTHIGADMDSLASMVAAQKLYKEGVLCFSGSSSYNVRSFLKKYESRFTVTTPRKIKMGEIDTLIVVDARSRNRIGPFGALLGDSVEKNLVETHVYDHHPPSGSDIHATYSFIEPLGAATTLMVELLLEHRVTISPIEATLFFLGIYEDTGALSFPSATERDFAAISALRSLHADLSAVPIFIDLGGAASERKLFDSLMDSAQERYIGGARVVISAINPGVYTEGLSLFAHKLRDAFDADVAIAVAGMGKRTYIVVRSRAEVLDSLKLLENLGGGGHKQAASASITGETDVCGIASSLEKRAEEMITPSMTVSRIMSSPVMAVEPSSSVEEVNRLMIRYGHAAFPVVDKKGFPVGIITRKNLDKAQLHGMNDLPVSDFMTEGVTYVSPDAPVAEAHRLLALKNIGRLPVISGNRLEGIVTRTDILRALYPVSLPPGERVLSESYPWVELVTDTIETRLPARYVKMMKKLGERAAELDMKAYVVGGFVRDIFIPPPARKDASSVSSLDMDIVIEGDALLFIKSWEECGCHTVIHDRFRTGTIIFEDDIKIDVATARREFYEYPVASPTISQDSLKHDLYRRDFTVNAMALAVNPDEWGNLMDYFGGRTDTENRLLRAIHNLSFVEDPSRALRGVRLEKRLGFKMESNTLRLLQNCVQSGLLTRLPPYRLRTEIEILFNERGVPDIVKRLAELCVIDAVFPGVRLGSRSVKGIRRLSIFKRMSSKIGSEKPIAPDLRDCWWIAFLVSMLADTPQSITKRAFERIDLSPKARNIAERGLMERGTMENILGARGDIAPSFIYETLQNTPSLLILIWAALTENSRLRKRCLYFLSQLKNTAPAMSGKDLIALGYTKGPEIGRMMNALRSALLDRAVTSLEEEKDWITANFPPEKINALHQLRKNAKKTRPDEKNEKN